MRAAYVNRADTTGWARLGAAVAKLRARGRCDTAAMLPGEAVLDAMRENA